LVITRTEEVEAEAVVEEEEAAEAEAAAAVVEEEEEAEEVAVPLEQKLRVSFFIVSSYIICIN
jgi:hypothetical protein